MQAGMLALQSTVPLLCKKYRKWDGLNALDSELAAKNRPLNKTTNTLSETAVASASDLVLPFHFVAIYLLKVERLKCLRY